MFEKITLTKEMETAMKKAAAVIAERERIAGAIKQAEADVPAAEAALQTALDALAADEADSVLATDSKSTQRAVRNAADARVFVDVANARVSGLRKKLAENDDLILAAEDELHAARMRFTRHVVSQFKKDLIEAAEPFVEALRYARGIENGLGCDLHLDVKIVDPENTNRELIQVFEKAPYQPGYGRREMWRENPTTARAYDPLVEVSVTTKKITEKARAIRDQRKFQAIKEQAQRTNFVQTGSFSSATI